MRRLITTLAVASLLVACSAAGSGGQSAGSAGSAGSSLGAEPSSAAASGSSDAAGTNASGTASAACAEAFAPIADLGVESTSALGDLAEVEATVTDCESVADWTAGAESALGIDVRAGTADLLLRIRCQDPSLSSAAICEELASS